MEWYAQAERLAPKAQSDTLKGRLYLAIARIYDNVLLDPAYANPYYERAAESFIRGGDTLGCVDARLEIIDNLIADHALGEASDRLQRLSRSFSEASRAGAPIGLMTACLALRSEDPEAAGKALSEYLAAAPSGQIDWLRVGEIRLALQDPAGAAAAIDSVVSSRSSLRESPACLKLQADVLAFEGHDREALGIFKRYLALKDSLEMKARRSGAKYINEQHQQELMLEKYRSTLMIVFGSIVLLTVAIIGIAVVLKRSRDEHACLDRAEKRARSRIREIQTEIELLKSLSGRNLQESPELRRLIGERLRLLENCLASVLSSKEDGSDRINEILNSIKEDRESFQESLRLTFCIIRPRFIESLEAKGLSREQINICCLYAIGMSGKEIIAYTSKKRTYNLSSEIRAKLGLGMHDTNLGKYLRELVGVVGAAVLLTLPGCSDPGQTRTREQLDRISVLIRSDADSAFRQLRGIPRSSLRTRELRARFAVLMSMAYDRNRIDIASDSLIRQAVDYYRHHGTPDDKVRALYYLGNTYLCAYDYESAIREFLRAEKYADRVKDLPILALLYNTSAYIYVKIKDPKAVEYYRKSADAFYAAGDTNRAIRTLLYRTIFCESIGADSIEEVTWREIERNKSHADKEYLHQYYGVKIDRGIARNDPQAVASVLDEYLTRYADAEKIEWGNVGDAQMFLGRYSESLSSWIRFSRQFPAKRLDYEYTYYYLKTAALYDSLGCYGRSLAEYRKYDRLNDSLIRNDMASDTKYLKERNQHELALKRSRTKTILFSLLGGALVILAVAMVCAYRIRRRINRRLRAEIEKDKIELENMQAQLERLRRLSAAENRQKMEIICERLETLNNFIAKSFAFGKGSGREIMSEIEELARDRDAFVESLHETFTLTHPEFLEFLRQKGLTREETFICCLYAIGLQGKDIMAYLGRKRHYLDSSGIRAKLGLTEHDTNLGRYLRSLC